MRDYASTRTNIHLSEGDIPKVEISVQTISTGDFVVLTLGATGHTATYFLYREEGQTVDSLLNSVLRSLSSPVISYDN